MTRSDDEKQPIPELGTSKAEPPEADALQSSTGNWICLSEVLRPDTLSWIAAVGDTVERCGIYLLDFANRPVLFRHGPEHGEALRLIRRVAGFLSGAIFVADDDRSPQDQTVGFPEDPFVLYGWPKLALPDFVEGTQDSTAPSHPNARADDVQSTAIGGLAGKTTRIADLQKKLDSSNLVIGALLRARGLRLEDSIPASSISDLLHKAGVEMSDNKIRALLQEVRDVTERRSKG